MSLKIKIVKFTKVSVVDLLLLKVRQKMVAIDILSKMADLKQGIKF